MSRWIDSDALDRAFSKLRFNNDGELEHYGDRPNWYLWGSEVENLIADAPSIDIEPKRGEWVKRTHDTLIAQVNFAYCSECGQPIMHEHTRSLWNFCPNCGADMRKGADDEALHRDSAE